MEGIYLFALVWILLNTYTMYHVLFKKNREEDRDELRSELIEMCRMISPSSVGSSMLVLYVILLLFDLAGFYLTYTYAYTAENHYYLRILLFLVFVLFFIVEQILSLRQTLKISAALKIPNIKDDVLKRFIRMTDRDMDLVSTLSSVAKFVAALQLVLYTILVTGQ
ncbi:MAG: hypothetical protein II778_06300 [Anaerovibrio sp.]|nr:hypothetical protein [Anaerovibrio sp.]